jgi:agmatinase
MKLVKMKPADGFLGIEEPVADAPGGRRAVIVPFGLEASVSYGGGTAKGPQAMIAASHEVELFDDELWQDSYRSFALDTLKEPKIPQQIGPALDLLAKTVGAVLAEGAFPLIFGGEHSITPGAIRPFLERHPDLALLHFDAHADLRDGYEGEPFSHASAIRRCMDHERLAVVSVGIRNISAEEIPFLEANRHRLHIHWAREKRSWRIKEILAPLLGRPVYLTFDIDGFDLSQMAATGTPEPGGFLWDEVMPILRKAFRKLDIVGADINELAPISGFQAYDFLAAKLAYKTLGYKFCQ